MNFKNFIVNNFDYDLFLFSLNLIASLMAGLKTAEKKEITITNIVNNIEESFKSIWYL